MKKIYDMDEIGSSWGGSGKYIYKKPEKKWPEPSKKPFDLTEETVSAPLETKTIIKKIVIEIISEPILCINYAFFNGENWADFNELQFRRFMLDNKRSLYAINNITPFIVEYTFEFSKSLFNLDGLKK